MGEKGGNRARYFADLGINDGKRVLVMEMEEIMGVKVLVMEMEEIMGVKVGLEENTLLILVLMEQMVEIMKFW
ncbi:hypothetical protein E2C01_101550 [Portunus trituberculatus]|uniref:Uncharacterized protein n=1 Tax=Portunus trituberculatus TaxID=210409 RepID=A0A5B7KM79_PORTR|nr:hypothetical protein [Portunus trituberculatus]